MFILFKQKTYSSKYYQRFFPLVAFYLYINDFVPCSSHAWNCSRFYWSSWAAKTLLLDSFFLPTPRSCLATFLKRRRLYLFRAPSLNRENHLSLKLLEAWAIQSCLSRRCNYSEIGQNENVCIALECRSQLSALLYEVKRSCFEGGKKEIIFALFELVKVRDKPLWSRL